MYDVDKRAHDLAIAFIRTCPPALDEDAQKYSETRLMDYAARYEEAYSYFKTALSKK